MLRPVFRLGHDRQIRQPIIARIAVPVINVLTSNGSFAVPLNHQPSSLVAHRLIFELLRSALVFTVLLCVVTLLCQGSLLVRLLE